MSFPADMSRKGSLSQRTCYGLIWWKTDRPLFCGGRPAANPGYVPTQKYRKPRRATTLV